MRLFGGEKRKWIIALQRGDPAGSGDGNCCICALEVPEFRLFGRAVLFLNRDPIACHQSIRRSLIPRRLRLLLLSLSFVAGSLGEGKVAGEADRVAVRRCLRGRSGP